MHGNLAEFILYYSTACGQRLGVNIRELSLEALNNARSVLRKMSCLKRIICRIQVQSRALNALLGYKFNIRLHNINLWLHKFMPVYFATLTNHLCML